MLLSVESPIVGAFALHAPRAALLHRNGLVSAVLPASKNMCKRIIEIPQELGRSCFVSSAKSRLEIPGDQLQAPAAHSSAGERIERVNAGGTAKRRQRSAAGWAAGSRSALIVPLKQGNSPWRTLWRKAKRRPADPVEGNMSGTSRLDPHVTVTRPDSLGDHRGWRICRSRNRMR